MTILFANPPWWVFEPTADKRIVNVRRGVRAGSRWPFTTHSSYIPGHLRVGEYLPYPMFLGSAAAWTKRALPDAEVVLRDSIARGESYQQFDEFWQENTPSHVVIETGAAALAHDLRYCQAMKKSHPRVRIAVAGPPARDISGREEWQSVVDCFMLGEFEKNSVKFAQGASGVLAPDMLTRDELKTSPFPLYDEACATNYFDANPRGQTWPHLQLWASRGCYHVCNFCAWPATMTGDDPTGKGGRPVRFYSADWIEAFIKERVSVAAHAGRPLQSVYFDDDSFNLKDKHVLEVCEVMKRIRLPWFAMCRADSIKEDTWREMRLSGCRGVKLGFESASQRVIDEVIHKKLNLKAAEETAKWLRSIGLTVHTTWAIGSPGELPEERQLTLETIRRFYREGVHDTHQISGIAEVPGTPLANTPHNDASYVKDTDGQAKAEQLLAK